MTLSPQCDLVDNREVSYEEGRDLAKNFGVLFFESSAKSRINVEEAFYELVRALLLISVLFVFLFAADDVCCRFEKCSDMRPLQRSLARGKPRSRRR